MWSIACTFHFPESEIWEMSMERLDFWSRGVRKVQEWTKVK